ncbi:MAG: efflux RND transporter periplasmic adaptor subunit [Deltaproteobacteria bacterium]|nr:efflux RND transporter periplasmic adaptor subunit [Deltaproteobacteria bacterium]
MFNMDFRKISIWILSCVVLAIAGCSSQVPEASNGKPGQRNPASAVKRPVPVLAAQAVQKDFPLEIRAIGNVESYATVAIKARVTGELQKIHFREGQEVTKGDLLFTIDPRPLEAALRESRARLEKDKALAEKAEADNRRYETLVQGGFISREQYDQIRSNLSSLQATVVGDEAVVENAKLQLGYTSIYSPISGRTGTILIDQGNMIKANDDNKSLIVIEQVHPIYVSFSVPEANLSQIMERMKGQDLVVNAMFDGSTSGPEKGRLSFVDNSVDSKTGTIRLKGTFDNTARRLWPGQFVNIALTLGRLQNVVTVPSQAVQTGESGLFVFVITAENTVQLKPVKTGKSYGGETIIESGIMAGEQVVTDGHLRLTPGASVEITSDLKPETNPSQAVSKEARS